MARNKIKMELVDDSVLPTRKSQYSWNKYFEQLLTNPTKHLKFTGVARSTVKDAVDAHNANDENKVKFSLRGKRIKVGGKSKDEIYVSVVQPEPPETEE